MELYIREVKKLRKHEKIQHVTREPRHLHSYVTLLLGSGIEQMHKAHASPCRWSAVDGPVKQPLS